MLKKNFVTKFVIFMGGGGAIENAAKGGSDLR